MLNGRLVSKFGPDLIALLLGAIVFAIFYGPEVLSARAPFLSVPIGDIASEMAGYFHFAKDQWRFPVFVMPTINLPEGSNLLFTGGVPLLAILAKLIQHETGETPNLFGFWYLLCCCLQTHSAFYLMRQITDQRPFLLAVSSVVAALAYAFLTRTGHVSLFGQFICIYGVAFLIATTNDWHKTRTILIALALLTFLSMLIFAYLAICNTVIFLSGVVSLWWLNRLKIETAAAICVTFFTSQLILAYGAGYFWGIGKASPSAIAGFSELGLNFGALIVPPKSILFPTHTLIPPWWEGDFYLGLGVIGLWILLLISSPAQIFYRAARHWPISIGLSMLAIYSFSNRITFLDETLLSMPLPDSLSSVLGMARTAGRLFWPSGYLIIAGAFPLIVIQFPRSAPTLLSIAIALACAEATGTYAFVRNLVSKKHSTPFAFATLQKEMSNHQSLFVLPTYWCNGSLNREIIKAYQQIELTSAKSGNSSNSSITARKIKDCDREARIGAPTFGPGRLFILMNETAIRQAFPIEDRAEVFKHCKGISVGGREGIMCSTRWINNESNQASSPLISGNPLSSQIKLDEEVSFAHLDTNASFLVSGWSPEASFAWTLGPESKLEFQLPPMPSSKLEIEISFAPLLHPTRLPERTISIFVANVKSAFWIINSGDWQTRAFNLPANLDGKPIQITLRQDDAGSPKQMGFSNEPRRLGIAVRSLMLKELH